MFQEVNNANEDQSGGLKSGPSLRPSYVRFLNCTQRRVDVIWINYDGLRVKYKTLLPHDFFDVNTFVNHPWIFRDSITHDKMVVSCRDVFHPEPWDKGLPKEGNVGPVRKLVCITIPMYTLKEWCFQAVRRHIITEDDVFKLGIPVLLQQQFLNYLNPTDR